MAELTPSTMLVASDSVVSCEFEGDSALLDLDSSRYYRLNLVGTHVWQSLAEPISVADIRNTVLDAFDVEPERCAADLDALLHQFLAAKLVEVHHGQTA